MANVQMDVRDRRRAAIRVAYEEVTCGERVALSSRLEVPAVLLRRLHPSITPPR